MVDSIRRGESQSPAIELHIEELVLHGFEPGQRLAIARAVEQALGALLLERGVPSAWAAGAQVDRLDAGQFQVAPGAGPETIGSQVAQALYAGATGPGGEGSRG